jgi:hypothetical protein
VRPLGRFVGMYVVRGGFLDGWRDSFWPCSMATMCSCVRPRSGRSEAVMPGRERVLSRMRPSGSLHLGNYLARWPTG